MKRSSEDREHARAMIGKAREETGPGRRGSENWEGVRARPGRRNGSEKREGVGGRTWRTGRAQEARTRKAHEEGPEAGRAQPLSSRKTSLRLGTGFSSKVECQGVRGRTAGTWKAQEQGLGRRGRNDREGES